jgi:uncharacterized protein involved in response to NO
LGFTPMTKLAFVLLLSGTFLRVAPEFASLVLPGPIHGLASVVWASAFLLWLRDYWPALSDPATLEARTC